MKKTKAYFRKQFDKEIKNNFDIIWWLHNNRKIIKNYEAFDYPHYAGMPTKIANKMSSLAVDVLQDNWDAILESRSIRFLFGLFVV